MYNSLEKKNISWYDISILPYPPSPGQTVTIFLLFRDWQEGCNFFNDITKDNPHPSFVVMQEKDGTHFLKIDYGYPKDTEFVGVHFHRTIDAYPPLNVVKGDYQFKIEIGAEQDGKVMGTNCFFIPDMVEYKMYQPQQVENPN